MLDYEDYHPEGYEEEYYEIDLDESHDEFAWIDYEGQDIPRPGVGLVVGIIASVFLLFLMVRSGVRTTLAQNPEEQAVGNAPASNEIDQPVRSRSDPYEFEAPYTKYVLTQGPHGQSYGQLAIDIAAGKGVEILSPINGVVAQKYTDKYGNPTLIIENDVYEVKMLHGIYSVSVGDEVSVGEEVGIESNLGYTTDMRGVRCAGRTDYCGYHTHLNVYDKERLENVNPLSLIND